MQKWIKQFSICLISFYFPTVFSSAICQENNYAIYALKFGERTNKIPIADVAVGAVGNDSVNVWFMYWLLKGNNGRIVIVDAGFTTDADSDPKFIKFNRPDSMLQKININPGDITDIIITHPHWDHIGGISLYPNAMAWMQKEDYEYFVGAAWQQGGNSGGFSQTDVTNIVRRNMDKKLTLVHGDDKEIIPGIRVFTGSKHTFESQFVLVNSKPEKVIIASDNCWFYYNVEKLLPITITHDADAYTKNLKRMCSMVTNKDLIIPGHDPLIFSKFKKVALDVVQIGE